MKTSAGLVLSGVVLALLAWSTPSEAQQFWRGGHICQRASSGYIVCRDPRDWRSPGYVIGGRPRPDYERQSRRHNRRGREVCQRASSGYIVCRDRRDRWSDGYVVGR